MSSTLAPTPAPASFQLSNKALAGRFTRLEPYSPENREQVRAALNCDSEAWNLFALSGEGAHFETWWSGITRQIAAGQWIAYALRDLASGKVVGTSSFLNIKPERQTVEIGATFLHPDARAGYVNAESKLLMLGHAFESGARRVEIVTDLRNLRSQAAIAKLGAVREGVLRRDRITWTGHVRDSVLFAITDLDWPAVQARLHARLNAMTPKQ